MYDASRASILPSAFTSYAFFCLSVSGTVCEVEFFAYIKRIMQASTASTFPSPDASPNSISGSVVVTGVLVVVDVVVDVVEYSVDIDAQAVGYT